MYGNVIDIIEESHPKFTLNQFGGEEQQRHQAGVMKRRLNRPQPFDQDEVVYDQKYCPTEAHPNGHDIYTAEQLDDPAVREELGVSLLLKSDKMDEIYYLILYGIWVAHFREGVKIVARWNLANINI